VLGDGQQFEVRKAEIDGIGDQGFGDALPVEEAAVFGAAPGPQMDFVDDTGEFRRLPVPMIFRFSATGRPWTIEAVEGRSSAAKP
jgi:hypothetical protein